MTNEANYELRSYPFLSQLQAFQVIAGAENLKQPS